MTDVAQSGDEAALSRTEIPDTALGLSVKQRVDLLKSQGQKGGQIVDRLVAAYCARIGGETQLSDAAKADKVRRFAFNLAGTVYRGPTRKEEDILVDVPVPSSVYDKVERAIQKAHLSQDAWLNQAIKDHLDGP